MPDLTFPVLGIRPLSFRWELVALTATPHQSPQTGQIQTQALPGAFWAASFDYSHARGDDYRALVLWLERMRGRAGRCRIGHPDHTRPRGTGGGSPVVAGAGQTGATLAISGGPASVSGWLAQFDMIEADGYLYRVTATVNTDGSGNASVPVHPPLRGSPANAAAVVLTNPAARMMLTAETAGTDFSPGAVRPVIFAVREVLS